MNRLFLDSIYIQNKWDKKSRPKAIRYDMTECDSIRNLSPLLMRNKLIKMNKIPDFKVEDPMSLLTHSRICKIQPTYIVFTKSKGNRYNKQNKTWRASDQLHQCKCNRNNTNNEFLEFGSGQEYLRKRAFLYNRWDVGRIKRERRQWTIILSFIKLMCLSMYPYAL